MWESSLSGELLLLNKLFLWKSLESINEVNYKIWIYVKDITIKQLKGYESAAVLLE